MAKKKATSSKKVVPTKKAAPAKKAATRKPSIRSRRYWETPQALGSGSAALKYLLPAMEIIPEEFHDHDNAWCEAISKFFFVGGRLPCTKAGIDPEHARLHLLAVLRSYEPKHQHKEAGAAWLMSLWYQMPIVL